MADILSRLNERQREVVEETQRPMLVIAGAGSGKTLTVATKIANLLEKGVKPESILALTFNENAAEELLEKVTAVRGASEDISISTFHSFCSQILQDNILDTKLNANFNVITETAQLVYFVRNINKFGIEHLEFNHEPYTLAMEMNKYISRCKDEFVSPDDLETYIKKHDKDKLEEEARSDLDSLKDIAKIYRAYEAYKTKNNMLDFGDMLFLVYDLLKSKPMILKRYQKQYEYVIVDEFQDTNFIQLQIVGLIANHGRITVVGDDDQSIYRFRGAYLTNIAEFKKMYPRSVEKALEQNYRSTKNILSVANALIENKPERTIKKLFTDNPEGEKVKVVETPTDTSQANYVVKTVKDMLKDRKMNDIAILCRRRSNADKVIEALRKHGIPFNFIGQTGFFSEPIVKDAVAYLRVISDPSECDAECVRILHRDIYGLTPTDIGKFNRFAQLSGLCLFDALEKSGNDKFVKVGKVLGDLVKAKKKTKLMDLLHHLLFSVDFYKYEIMMGNKRNVSLLNQFYRIAQEYDRLYEGELEDFVEYVSYASNFEIEEQDSRDDAVSVSTIHGVKGMEFPVVIIVDAADRKIPTNFMRDKFVIPQELLRGIRSGFDDKELHLQEERRLFYVALTRAREKLIITYARRYGENKRDSRPSKFLEEFGYDSNKSVLFEEADAQEAEIEIDETKQDTLMKEVVSSLRMGEYRQAIEKVLILAKGADIDVAEMAKQLREPVDDPEKKEDDLTPKSFSVSQFGTYKRCPKGYYYKYFLRVPEKPKYFFEFGGAIHNVVEELTKMMKDGKKVDERVALELLRKNWNPKGYKSKVDEKRDYIEAEKLLIVFLAEQEKIETEIVDIERDFTLELDGIKIRGRIDRIDKDGDEYIVIDYKTSKNAASIGEIREDMQLLLYSMVTEKLYGKRPKSVGLWYLRPNEKKFVQVDDELVKAIVAQIKEIVSKINAKDFRAKPGFECRYCDYDCLCDDCKC